MKKNDDSETVWKYGYEGVAIAAGLCLGIWFVGLIFLIGFSVWIGD